MDESEIADILSLIPSELHDLRSSLLVNDLLSSPCLQGVSEKREYLPALANAFRGSKWHVSFAALGNERTEFRLLFRRKNLLGGQDRVANRCFHVTRASALEKILAEGIKTGAAVAAPTRGALYLDSAYYIHVSLSIENAIWWRDRLLPQEGAAIVAIRMDHQPEIRLYADPISIGPDGSPLGFIVDDDSVPQHLIEVVKWM
ncbi:hypothetical protein GC163_17255 [bacterium]|nr:hypothetical protein [bacterium]